MCRDLLVPVCEVRLDIQFFLRHVFKKTKQNIVGLNNANVFKRERA